MDLHIANILRDIMLKPQKMVFGEVVGADAALEAMEIEADAMARALGQEAVDAMAVQFLDGCRNLPTENIHDTSGIKTESGRAVAKIDQIGHIIIARMVGNPWDTKVSLADMTQRLNRLHCGQMGMDATLRAALGHPGAPAIEHIQAAGITRAHLCVDMMPLHWAAGSNNPGVAAIWLEHGVDPNGRDQDDRAPMSRAIGADMVSTLLANGASLNDVDGAGTWAPDYWKSAGVSDSARMQMMGRAIGHLLEGNTKIDKTRAKSIVRNLPAVKKMQASMERSGLEWWEAGADGSIGQSFCCHAIVSSETATGGAIKRMLSLLGAAGKGASAGEAPNADMLALANAHLAVRGGDHTSEHAIKEGAGVPGLLGEVLGEANATLPAGSGTLKSMVAVTTLTHQLLVDGLALDRAWLEPLSLAAAKCMETGTTADGAQLLMPWMGETFTAMSSGGQQDLLPLLVPMVFYSSSYRDWDSGDNHPLLDIIMQTPCHYHDQPNRREELARVVEAFGRFTSEITNTILRGKLKPVVAMLEAKLMQASCAPAAETSSRSGPRF